MSVINEISGPSISGLGTAIALPDFDICFDIGVNTPESFRCSTVVVTHGHLDHLNGIVRHAYVRNMQGGAISRFIVPKHLVAQVHDLFKLWSNIQQSSIPGYTVVGIEPGETIQLGKGKRFLRAFKTDHRIPSQGYIFGEVRSKLKAVYQGTPGPEIGRLRKAGVQVTDDVEVLHFAFTGDTRASIWVKGHEALKAEVLVTECTFLGTEQTREFAQERGHTHIDELAELADLFENDTVMLCHWSDRYSNRDISEAVCKLPEALRSKVFANTFSNENLS